MRRTAAIRATPRSLLAQEIVARFHSRGGGRTRARRIRGALPRRRDAREHARSDAAERRGGPSDRAAREAGGLVDSTSEALRLIAQRGLKLDGDVVADKALVVAAGRTVVVQAGKRKFARVIVH